MLKQIVSASILSISIISLPTTSLAIKVEEIPNPRQINNGWVTDQANILSPTIEAKLNQMISQLEAENGSEIAVVTVMETAPSATPKELATNLFNYWGIGKASVDNGVLFLISKGDRRVEIETGYGVEGILPDARVGNIIQQKITPRFKQGNFDGGTLAGTEALVVALKADAPTTNPDATNTPTTNIDTNQPSAAADKLLLVYPLAAVLGIWVVVMGVIFYKSRSPIFIEPEGRSRHHHRWWLQPLHCTRCQKLMQPLDSALVLPCLSQPEQVAQNLGSVSFKGWQCPDCRPNLTRLGVHIRASILNDSKFSSCPTCQELTVKRTEKILNHATQYSEGRRLITYKCQCCNYCKKTVKWIPRLPPPPPPSSSSSSSSSSSDYGGGSFGGGDSGGSGAGGSW